jgi:hypothetical protein
MSEYEDKCGSFLPNDPLWPTWVGQSGPISSFHPFFTKLDTNRLWASTNTDMGDFYWMTHFDPLGWVKMGQFLVFIRFSPNLTRIIYEQVQARIWVISLSHPESVTQTIYKQLRTCVGVPFIAITISFKNTHASTLPAIFHFGACYIFGKRSKFVPKIRL